MEKDDFSEKILEVVENSNAFWQKGWKAGEIAFPENAVTKNYYSGSNSINLIINSPDRSDGRFCTFKQAQEQGWKIKKNSHGIKVKKIVEVDKEKDDIKKEDNEKKIVIRYYTVFHASQIDGIPELKRDAIEQQLENDPRIIELAKNMNVPIDYIGDQALYSSQRDDIRLPRKELFDNSVEHDTTLLHELSHATGHEKRLNRPLGNKFGSEAYAKEELRAEISAAMTALKMGIGYDPEINKFEKAGVENSGAYIKDWLSRIPEENRASELSFAMSDANKISKYLVEHLPKIEKEITKEKFDLKYETNKLLNIDITKSVDFPVLEGQKGNDFAKVYFDQYSQKMQCAFTSDEKLTHVTLDKTFQKDKDLYFAKNEEYIIMLLQDQKGSGFQIVFTDNQENINSVKILGLKTNDKMKEIGTQDFTIQKLNKELKTNIKVVQIKTKNKEISNSMGI